MTLLQLYGVALVLGIGTVVFDIAYLAYLPRTHRVLSSPRPSEGRVEV